MSLSVQGLDRCGNMRATVAARDRQAARKGIGRARCTVIASEGVDVAEARSATAECQAHHWILSEPSGGEVPGRCKLCGKTREFPANPSNPYLRGLAKKRPTRRES